MTAEVEVLDVTTDDEDGFSDADAGGGQSDSLPLIADGKKFRPKVSRARLVYEPSGRGRSKPSGWALKKCLLAVLLALIVSGCALTFYLVGQERSWPNTAPTLPQLDFRQLENMVTFDEILHEDFQFDMAGNDVMVFLHMQKTGGTTFGRHLVQDIDLKRPCQCHKRRVGRKKARKMRCNCFRQGEGEKNWLFSRYSMGWKCGLHADWTELTGCVDTYLRGLEGGSVPRRYFYITFMREPVARYLSEFRHVQRGATWRKVRYQCGGVSWAPLLPKCYRQDGDESDWSGVSLQEFMRCPHNMATNRQARMLADLNLVNCYNRSGMAVQQRDAIILASAKNNLERMSYFGLTERQTESQFLFEETFNLEFKVAFKQYNSTESSDTRNELSDKVIEQIKLLNHLDAELYEFAKKLLSERFEKMKSEDQHYEDHMKRLKDIGKESINWKDIENESLDYDDVEKAKKLFLSNV